MNKDRMVNLEDYLQSEDTDLGAIVVYFDCPDGYETEYPFGDGEELLFLSCIVGMEGHGAFVNKSGTVYWGYHTNSFYVDYFQ